MFEDALLSDDRLDDIVKANVGTLYDYEGSNAVLQSDVRHTCKAIAKAQHEATLRMVVKWLEASCTEHPRGDWPYEGEYFQHRLLCPMCRAELRQAAGGAQGEI